MVISSGEIFNLCCVISQQRNLNVCITESAKAGLITGGVTFVTAAVLGPLAIIPAAAVGGLLAHKMSKQYVPLYKILSEMSAADKEKLCEHIRNIVIQLEITDGIALLAIATSSDSASYGRILGGMSSYFRQSW